MQRRKFINLSSIGMGALASAPVLGSNILSTAGSARNHSSKISEIKKNTAIAMWDFSWILRHHRYGSFENWDAVLEGLAERGYDSIRIDAMPQFVAADTDGSIQETFRSVHKDWKPVLWGNNVSMSFNPRKLFWNFYPSAKNMVLKWDWQHGF